MKGNPESRSEPSSIKGKDRILETRMEKYSIWKLKHWLSGIIQICIGRVAMNLEFTSQSGTKYPLVNVYIAMENHHFSWIKKNDFYGH